MKKANLVSSMVGIAISAYVIIVSFGFKKFKNLPIGPEFFPRWLAIGLLICSIFLLIEALNPRGKDTGSPTISLKDPNMQRVAIALVGLVVYALLWETIGFMILTPFAMFGLMYLLKMRKWPMMVIVSVVVSIATFFIFKILLGQELPLGLLDGIL